MPDDRLAGAAPFAWIEELGHADPNAALERIVQRFKDEKRYSAVFNARLMKRRFELGLPLLSQPSIDELPVELQPRYQAAYVEAAREVGQLFLSDGNIPAAWPYFRAVGDVKPIADALEAFDMDDPAPPDALEGLSATIQIAFNERVHPRKGFALILKHFGMCRAVTTFGAYPSQDGRQESLSLLVRALHTEILENLKREITAVEGLSPDSESIPALIDQRTWLFENNAQYTDSSHLSGLLRFCSELHDEAALRLAVEMADYGRHLSPMFQDIDDPPFDRGYDDRAIYLRALAGEDVDRAIAHFEARAAQCDPYRDGTRPAEVLIELLSRLGRYPDAIRAFRRYVSDVPPDQLSCPTLPQLCELAGDFDQLREVAREQADPLSYVAAILKTIPRD